MEEILGTNDKGRKFLKVGLIIFLCTSLINFVLIFSFLRLLITI